MANSDATFRRLLGEIAGTGEIITVVYDGGSQPGTRRDIIVRRVETDRVMAHCLASGNSPRTFLIDRMRLAEGDEPLFSPGLPSARLPPTPASLPSEPPRPAARIGLLGGIILFLGIAFWFGQSVKLGRWLLGH